MITIANLTRRLTLCIGIAVIGTGCADEGSNEDGPRIICDPGVIQECLCPGNQRGLQTCVEGGVRWGPCEGCGAVVVVTDADIDTDTDTDTDIDTDTDGDTPLGECEYNTCTGDICVEDEGCCVNAACDSWVYYDTESFSETYCYPMCDTVADEPCKCGDVCVPLDTLELCLKTGSFTMDNLTIVVGEAHDDSFSVETTGMNFSGALGDDALTLEYVSASWNEWQDSSGGTQRGIDVWFDGMADGLSVWILAITIMEETFTRGVGEYQFFDDDNDETTNFYADVYYANLDRATSEISEAWLETLPDVDTSVLSINQICDTCPIDETDCTQCSFSFNFSWAALRAKLVM